MTDETEMIQQVAMKAVIVNPRGQILLLREARINADGTNKGGYDVPGGRLNIGEAFMDGLLREIDEETGLTVTVGQPFFVGEWRPVIRGKLTQIIATFFVCHTDSDDVRLSEEHDDFVWVEPSETQKYNLLQPIPSVIEAYLATVET
jgi:8-oxo-dGTP pyrophosphatase MutT (NUDIX family)